MIDGIANVAVKSPSEFMIAIDRLAVDKRISYLDAVILYCQQNDIEIETAASLIKGSAKMKAKIQDDAEELNFLPRSGKLPI